MPLVPLINNRIAGSGIAPRAGFPPFTNLVAQGVFIANPWPTINVTGIGKPTGTGNGAVQQTIVMDPNAFLPVLTQIQLKGLGWANGRPTAAEVVQQYLEQGAAGARAQQFYAVCEGFTAATIALLVATKSTLPPGTTVEWFGMKTGGINGTGHAFTVVDRAAGSADANPATWGNGCLIADQWYALQAGVTPAFRTNGPHRSNTYMNWLTSPGNVIWSIVAFTVGSYPYLNF